MDKFKYKVLLIENLEIAQKVAKIRLNDLGCEVEMANTGEEALELFKNKKYDLILMDLGLEDMDGLAVTKAIREIEKQNKQIPIVVLTANGDQEIRKSCLEVGANDFFLKPFTSEIGLGILRKHLF